jgi:hypothetical protein
MRATSSTRRSVPIGAAVRFVPGFVMILTSLLLASERTARVESPVAIQQARFDELPAAWGDLDTWSRYVPATDETEVGIGLKTAGADTTMLVAFSARMKGASPSQAPSEVFVHASAGVNANAGNVRNKTLKFVLASAPAGAGGQRPVRAANGPSAPVIDLSSRLGADNESPGARVNFATAKLAPAEFLRIVKSGQPTATVLGVDVAFRPDQLRALRAFANRIFLRVPETR